MSFPFTEHLDWTHSFFLFFFLLLLSPFLGVDIPSGCETNVRAKIGRHIRTGHYLPPLYQIMTEDTGLLILFSISGVLGFLNADGHDLVGE